MVNIDEKQRLVVDSLDKTLTLCYNTSMVLRNTNSSNPRPPRPTSPANSMDRVASRANPVSGFGLDRRTPSMQNRPMPGDIRRKAMQGDATLGVRTRYTPIAQVVADRQAYNSGNSMSAVTRPRGINGPRAL